MQNIYVFYSGQGSEEFFTAKDDTEAKEFLSKEKRITNSSSSFRTHLTIEATRNFWLPLYKIIKFDIDITKI